MPRKTGLERAQTTVLNPDDPFCTWCALQVRDRTEQRTSLEVSQCFAKQDPSQTRGSKSAKLAREQWEEWQKLFGSHDDEDTIPPKALKRLQALGKHSCTFTCRYNFPASIGEHCGTPAAGVLLINHLLASVNTGVLDDLKGSSGSPSTAMPSTTEVTPRECTSISISIISLAAELQKGHRLFNAVEHVLRRRQISQTKLLILVTHSLFCQVARADVVAALAGI